MSGHIQKNVFEGFRERIRDVNNGKSGQRYEIYKLRFRICSTLGKHAKPKRLGESKG